MYTWLWEDEKKNYYGIEHSYDKDKMARFWIIGWNNDQHIQKVFKTRTMKLKNWLVLLIPTAMIRSLDKPYRSILTCWVEKLNHTTALSSLLDRETSGSTFNLMARRSTHTFEKVFRQRLYDSFFVLLDEQRQVGSQLWLVGWNNDQQIRKRGNRILHHNEA